MNKKITGVHNKSASPVHGPDFEEKRLALLRAAAREFNTRGYHRTSLKDLSEILGVGKATLYHYIKSKDEILLECAMIAFSNWQVTVNDLLPEPLPAIEKIRTLIRFYIEDFVTDDFGACLALNRDAALDTTDRVKLRNIRREIDQTMRSLLKESLEEGSIRNVDVKMASFYIFGALNWVPQWYSPKGPYDRSEIAKSFLDFFDTGFAKNG